MNEKPRVLITGASGLIGTLTIRELGHKYAFSGLSRRPVAGIPHLQADVADLAAIRPAFQEIDAVLHLACYVTAVEDWDGMLEGNVLGTTNVFRAAQEAGVKRVVFMSTGSTMCGYEWFEGSPYGMMARGEYDRVPAQWDVIDHTWAPRPDSPYAIGKLYGEATGRYFSDKYGMSVINIRLGAVLDTDRPKLRRHFPGYLSQADAAQMIDLCLSAPAEIKYDTFDAISDNRWRWRSTERAKRILGYKPTGHAEDYELA